MQLQEATHAWPQIPDSCTRVQKTATHKSSMSTGPPPPHPHRSLSPNPTLPVHACKEDCKVKKSDAKQRADNALAMNKKLGVSAGRCPVTLIRHEAIPSHGMGPATMGRRHRTLHAEGLPKSASETTTHKVKQADGLPRARGPLFKAILRTDVCFGFLHKFKSLCRGGGHITSCARSST